jgi:hypothetical protein
MPALRQLLALVTPERPGADKAAQLLAMLDVIKAATLEVAKVAQSQETLGAGRAVQSPAMLDASKVAMLVADKVSPEALAAEKPVPERLPATLEAAASKAALQAVSLRRVRRAQRSSPTAWAIPLPGLPARIARSGTSVNVALAVIVVFAPARSIRLAPLVRRAVQHKSTNAY